MFFPEKCDVLRRSSTSQGYGSKPAYASHLSQTSCVYSEDLKSGFNSITAEWIKELQAKMLFPVATDVQSGDRITNISFRDGSTITKVFQVEMGEVKRNGRMHRHKTVGLKLVS